MRKIVASKCLGADSVGMECVESTVLAILAGIAVVLCVIMIVVPFIRRKIISVRRWGIALLLLSVCEASMVLIHNLFFMHIEWIYIAQFFENVQLAFLAYTFAKHALHSFKKTIYVNRYLLPAFVGCTLILITISGGIVLSSAIRSKEDEDCRDLRWIMLISCGFVMSSLFAVSCMIVLSRLKHLRMSTMSQQRKREYLARLTYTFFVCGVIGFLYDITLASLDNKSYQCEHLIGISDVDFGIRMGVRFVDLLIPVYTLVALEFLAIRYPIKHNRSFRGQSRVMRERRHPLLSQLSHV